MAEVVHPLPPARRALVTAVTLTATMMVVLDTTIAMVALPHMQATLGATSETIAWVLTSYILASAIALPITGWLANRLGRRRLFMIAVGGFTLTSALCGVANSLVMMVVARLLQGIFGAFIMPLGQAVLFDINPRERHARAMATWGIVIVVGPILGPMVGGHLTDALDWRWVFFINVPIGLVATIGGLLLSPERGERRPFDLAGFAMLAIALGALQLALDRGVQLDWFDSTEIIIECGITLAALWMFAIHTATARHPIVPIELFRDRSFVVGLTLVAIVGAIFMSSAALLSPMLQTLLNYPVVNAGMVVMPRGIGTMAGMILGSRLIKVVDGRITIVVGLALVAWSLKMMTAFNLEMSARPVIISGLIQGLGLGLTMLPLNLLSFATIAVRLRTDAASLYSLTRNIGGSIAISVGGALIARNLQTSHADLGAHITAITVPLLDAGLIERMGQQSETALRLLDAEINHQALMIAYLDDYWLMMWAALLAMPLVLLMRPAKPGPEPIAIGE